MSHTYLVFDFAENEDAAQRARHKLEGWKQAFRLDKKLLFKFERAEAAKAEAAAAAKPEKEKSKEKSKSEEAASEPGGRVRLLVRLDFSDHEKLSQQRWLERIPADDNFKDAAPKTIRAGDADFSKTAELFESLDDPSSHVQFR